MYPKARDLEIVCNLVWRSKPHHSDDRANIVGMYDIPSTTLNWETFKSYLLKNSGSNASDIKVSYVDSDEKEIAINNGNDFQLALYSFRRRARIGEIITLKLDKVSCRKSFIERASMLIHSTDAEIQTNDVIDSLPHSTQDDDTPPKWFNKYMKKFEKKMMEEMKQQFALMGTKMQNTCQHSHPSRSKSNKPESYKRPRKFEFTKVNLDKDMCKKYAFKLDESEQRPSQKPKVKKITAMKISSDSDVGRETKKVVPLKPINFFVAEPPPPLNDVELNSSSDKTAGPLYTNSVYLQRWEVTNTGLIPWDERTELRYAWGSEKLRPTFTILKCPELQPGEKGEISVWFQIPSTPGSYECFWHFYVCGRRFGRWIGCQLIVVDCPLKAHSPYTAQPLDLIQTTCIPTVDTLITSAKLDPIDLSLAVSTASNELPLRKSPQETTPVTPSVNDLLLVETSANNLDYTSNCEPSSDSDNISILSGVQTPHSASSDYVVIPSPDTTTSSTSATPALLQADAQQENVVSSLEEQPGMHIQEHVEVTVEEATFEAKESDTKEEVAVNDAVSVASEAKSEPGQYVTEHDDIEPELRDLTLAAADVESSEYAYIYYNGEKYPFHKEYLREEYFTTAEKCPSVSVSVSSKSPSVVGEREGVSRSRQASTSSLDSKRLFVFPRHSPGFEVVYPADDASNPKTGSSCSYEGEEYYSIKDGFQFPPTSESNFYQEPQASPTVTQAPSKEYVRASPPARVNTDPPFTPRVYGVDVSSLAMPHMTESRSSSATSRSVDSAPTAPPVEPPPRAEPKFNGRVYRPSTTPAGKTDNIISEAAMMAGNAIGSVRSVVNMVMNNGNGKWVNGHWVADGENTKRENGLKILAEMGFTDRDFNATLLARYNDDVHRVISELVQ